jgi:hypothetical protein
LTTQLGRRLPMLVNGGDRAVLLGHRTGLHILIGRKSPTGVG